MKSAVGNFGSGWTWLVKKADGTVDIVVGTHKLLSPDVKYKRLGLLVTHLLEGVVPLPFERPLDGRGRRPLRMAGDEGRHRATVIGRRYNVGRVPGGQMVGMHEIGVQAVRPGRDAFKQRVRAVARQRVPADLRDLERGIGRCHLDDIAFYPAETLRRGLFKAARGHQLHANADPEERSALVLDDIDDRVMHAGNRIEPAAAVGIGADPRKYDPVGRGHPVCLIGQLDRHVKNSLARRAFESLGRRAQVARSVVDDRYTHVISFPLDAPARSRQRSKVQITSAVRKRPAVTMYPWWTGYGSPGAGLFPWPSAAPVPPP